LGVLGSVNKISVMFNALKSEGFSQSQLDRVHAPIGLNINSQTTEEIAVSIAAEIIKIRSLNE
jgi:xanthine dehydrogenase accessory factor